MSAFVLVCIHVGIAYMYVKHMYMDVLFGFFV